MSYSLNEELCYRALLSRDARFDGRFFAAVCTTGIYCRSVCPARKPKRGNVVFFRTAAEAETEGFRPCLRCRPETTPGSPDWLPSSHIVSRGIRMIHGGFLNEHRVPELAMRFGLSERQLDRLFVEELGATPAALARTQRVHLAQRLLSETDMPITYVALAAGYQSLRRLNASVSAAYDCAPRELRKGRGPVSKTAGGIVLCLPYRPPMSFAALLRYLAPRCIPGVERVTRHSYLRMVAMGATAGCIELRKAKGLHSLELRIPVDLYKHVARIVARVQRLFDLRSDISIIQSHLRHDPRLCTFPALRHVRLPGAYEPFEMAVRAILGQQVSVQAASTIAGRLVARFGLRVSSGDLPLSFIFPTAEVLANVDVSRVGLPAKRALAIQELAAAVCDGRLELDPAADIDTSRMALLELPGVGPWTADYICMRALSHTDSWPSGDLGLQKAFAGPSGRLSARELERHAERWRPWRSYAAMAIWMSNCKSGG